MSTLNNPSEMIQLIYACYRLGTSSCQRLSDELAEFSLTHS